MNALNSIVARAEQCSDTAQLKQLHDEVAFLLSSFSFSFYDIFDVYDALCMCHDALMKQALLLAEREVDRQGIGKKPSSFCWFVMGSSGRKEPTVWTDQDNGVIFSCLHSEKDDCYVYMREYARLGVLYLNKIGYPYCPGYVMATNERWLKEVEEWNEQVEKYVTNEHIDDIRYLSMLADMRPIYGEYALANQLKTTLYKKIGATFSLRSRMIDSVRIPFVPIGPFGRVYVERWGEKSGMIDIKQGGYVPLNHVLKWVAVQKQFVHAYSTFERLTRWYDEHGCSQQQFERIEKALQTFLYFRLRCSLEESDLSIQHLSKEEKQRLKKAMIVAKKMQRHARKWV
ncbi:signal-transduction protein with cAMP-binding, CBS, and nucleotidyltransferase domain [Anoxybacillus kamchatkensis]|uniref:DUF294 nucleotidyltransferase-like domain-containing protein n=1 Tax=Anoxybacillus ayderensis TaxID=265546 RepID=UPI0015EBA09B|nr:DUF294 nucleotidyltransferase-like domain-containing protein [Anoxybacillus ayderensis]MBA2878222.1 signal-transduction protein with cAMP-binding, CBS, and nucleotidyltransferase domain [Anoxybacillus ayderensis]